MRHQFDVPLHRVIHMTSGLPKTDQSRYRKKRPRMLIQRIKLHFATVAISTLLLSSCSKEAVRPVDVGGDTESELVNPKTNPFFLRDGVNNTGSFTVYRWSGSCATPYGFVTSEALAPNNLILNGNPRKVRVTNGQTTGVDNFYLRLEAGNTIGTVNSWGPWYLIHPNFGPSLSVRKSLLIRMKRVALGDNTYQAGISYNGTTNTWDYSSASQQGKYEFAEVIGIFSSCPVRN